MKHGFNTDEALFLTGEGRRGNELERTAEHGDRVTSEGAVTLGANMTRRVLAAHDQNLMARVVDRWLLVYSDQADCPQDRPGHVRAGSSMVRIGGRLAVIQDDAHFVADIDTNERTVRTIALPVGHLGQRQFDDVRGNKQWKTDLEACTTIVEAGRESLLILGSGSNARREQILIVAWPPQNEQSIEHFHAAGFYATLRAQLDFAGCELNIEGAVMLFFSCPPTSAGAVAAQSPARSA